jgi:putative DNA primase/helicase
MSDDDEGKLIPFTVVGGSEPPTDDEAEHLVAYLAGLSTMQYELQRERIAAKLRMRLSALDKIVEAKRKEQEQQKSGLLFERVPSATPVAGAELVRDLITDLTRYVSLNENYAAVAAFWALHTYTVNQCFISPRLAITAPQPRCGKTTLVNWLATVVQRPMSSVNVSPASVYRIVEKRQPTLLIDEADTFLGTNHELRGVLNSGHQQNGHVLRWDMALNDVRAFSTFCACAISLIGSLPPTLQDRSIRIRLRRRLPNEPIASLRSDQSDDTLARRCARWAVDNQYLYDATEPKRRLQTTRPTSQGARAICEDPQPPPHRDRQAA